MSANMRSNLLKPCLCSAPVLSAPDYSRGFKIDVDASATGAGAVLLQDDGDGVEHPVAYFSKKFLPHQKNYSTIEKEALALLLSLQHLKSMLDRVLFLYLFLLITIRWYFYHACAMLTKDLCVGPYLFRILILKFVIKRVRITY